MSFLYKRLRLAILPLLLFASAAGAAEYLLPGDIVIHVQTQNYQRFLSEVQKTGLAATRGTPNAAFFQPGMLATQLTQMAGLPPGFIAKDQPLHFVVSFPKTGAGQPVAGLLLHVGELLSKIDNMKKMGLEIPAPQDGVFQLQTPFLGKLFLVDAGHGRAAVSSSAATAGQLAAAVLNWTPANLPAGIDAPSLVTAIDLQKLVDRSPQDWTATLNRSAAGIPLPKDFPFTMPAMTKFIGTIGRDLAEQADHAETALFLGGDRIKTKCSLTPLADTKMQQAGLLAANETNDGALMRKLPAGGLLYTSANVPPALVEIVNAPLLAALKTMAEESEQPDVVTAVEKLRIINDLTAGDMAQAQYAAEDGRSLMQLALVETTDGATYKTAFSDIWGVFGMFLDSMFVNFKVPLTITPQVVEKAGIIEEVPYGRLGFTMEVPPETIQQVPQMAMITPMLDRLNQQMTYNVGALDNIVVMVNGMIRDEVFAKAVKNYRAAVNRIESDAVFMQRFNETEHKQLGYTWFDFLALIRAQTALREIPFLQEVTNAKLASMDAAPQTAHQPSILTYGAGKEEDQGDMILVLDMPIEPLNEYVKAEMKGIQVMRQRQQELMQKRMEEMKPETTPEPREEEKPEPPVDGGVTF